MPTTNRVPSVAVPSAGVTKPAISPAAQYAVEHYAESVTIYLRIAVEIVADRLICGDSSLFLKGNK